MAIARVAAILMGAIALLAALGFISWSAYTWNFTQCRGDAECMGSFATFLLIAVVLLPIGVTLVMVGRSLPNPK
jgi:uncharacterized membrane protein